jgi:hypothetical protein
MVLARQPIGGFEKEGLAAVDFADVAFIQEEPIAELNRGYATIAGARYCFARGPSHYKDCPCPHRRPCIGRFVAIREGNLTQNEAPDET